MNSACKPFCDTCGCGIARYVFTPNEHKDEDTITKVGDEIECERCDHYATALAALKALRPEDVQHARYRSWCGEGALYVYKRDHKSPTGVTLLMSITATKEAEDVLRNLGASPLSPTEGLGGR